jgi:hypothetical protein
MEHNIATSSTPSSTPVPIFVTRLSSLRISFLDLAILLLLAAAVLPTPTDPDMWWHLKVGQDALHGILPFNDIYTWSMPDYAWVNHEWLTDILMTLIYQASGLTGLGVVFASIICVVYLIATRTGMAITRHISPDAVETNTASWRLALMLAGVAILANTSILGARPQMITLAGFALLNHLVWQFMLGNRRSLWRLPLVFWLWASLHGGFVIALVQLGLTLVLLVAAQCLPFMQGAFPFAEMLGIEGRRRIRHLALVCVSCFVATLINPYTYRVYEEAARTSMDQFARAHIVEWMSVNFQEISGILVGMFCLVFLWWLLWTRKYHSAWHILLMPLYLYLGMSSIRHSGLLVVFMLPWMYVALASQPSVRNFLHSTVERLFRVRLANALYYGYNAALLLMALAVFVVRAQSFVRTTTDPAIFAQKAMFPYQAVQYLKAHTQPGDLLWNDYAWGGYLIWHLPEHKVYVDGRMASWRDDSRHILKEYIEVSRLGPDWMKVLATNHVTLILTGKESSLANTLRHISSYTPLYEDDLAVLFGVKMETQ